MPEASSGSSVVLHWVAGSVMEQSVVAPAMTLTVPPGVVPLNWGSTVAVKVRLASLP